MDKELQAAKDTASKLWRESQNYQEVLECMYSNVTEFDHLSDEPLEYLNWIEKYIEKTLKDLDSAINIARGIDVYER